MRLRRIEAGVLDITYASWGDADGWPCILGHGFPYDPHAYEEAAARLAAAGAWVVVPYLRGFGPTRFLSAATPRSGEQAVLGADLLALMDALQIERAVLGGYDWGGRAACVVAALWPERVVALVSGNSYNIQDIARAQEPASPAVEASLWYQYYFHSERGRRGLASDRDGIARLLCGCGRRPGTSTTPPLRDPPRLSTTRISSRSSSIPTGTGSGWWRETLRWPRSRRG